ncbi:ABC-2 type transporter-domain-containing protein [Haematococcus lacustris]
MLTFAWIAFFIGLIFYNLPATPEAVQLRLNLHYSNTSFFLLMPYISMSLYTSDRQYYLADISSSLYRPIIYYIAKVCATLPANLLSAIIFSLITYGMAGLRHSALACVRVTTILSILSLIAVQVLHCAAILAPNQDMAFMMAIAWTAVNLLMSNFFIMYSQMAFNWLSQLRWISAMGYAFGGLAQEELRHAAYNCSQGIAPGIVSLLPRLLPNTPALNSPLVSQSLNNPGASCELRGDALLQYFNLTRPFAATLGIMLGYLLVMHILTYLALVLVSRKERR